MSQGLGPLQIAELFLYLAPFFLLILLPVACMLSVFLTFLRLSSDRELLALKAGGVSLYRLLPAPALFCTLCMLATLWVSFFGLSWGMENFRTTVLHYARTQTQLMLQPGVFNQEFPGLTLFAQNAAPGSNKMKGVFVRDNTQGDVKTVVVAPKGKIKTKQEKGELRFYLYDGHIYRRDGNRMDVLGFDRYIVRLDLDKLFQGLKLGDIKPKEMSWNELKILQAKAHDPVEAAKLDEDYNLRKVDVEIQKRLALPFACLVLGMFALPFACAFQGMKQYLGLVLSLGFFLVYYTMLSVGLSLGETGVLSPVVGLWIPNGVFAVAAILITRMAARERVPRVGDWVSHLRAFTRKKECA